MKLIAIFISLIFLPFSGFCQALQPFANSAASQQEAASWLKGLYEPGLDMTEDSIFISEEFFKVLREEPYRKTLYPEKYTWEGALEFMKTNDLKKAFWFFINLYPESPLNKELVVKSILAYDNVLQMDKIIVSTFYTYSFMDPQSSVIINGNPEITRPDILEKKLATVKDIVGYIYQYRAQKTKTD